MLILHFKTITPVFIASGKVLEENFHYRIDDNQLKKYNESKIIADLESKIDIQECLSIGTLTQKIVEQHYTNASFFDYCIEIDETFKSFFYEHERTGKNEVYEFISGNGKFYVPGSTIKGCLRTVLGCDSLRSNPLKKDGNDRQKKINGQKPEFPQNRFVIRDSNPISNENFGVYHFERPVGQTFIAMKPDTGFSIVIPKQGIVTKKMLEDGIKSYFSSQIKLAKVELKKYNKRNDQDLPARKAFIKIGKKNGQLLVNLGFGGGSWFKVWKSIVPKFNKNKKSKEIPTTTYYYGVAPDLTHIGWCSVEVEEC